MYFNQIWEYLKLRISTIIETMQESQTQSNSTIIMTIFALQRCSMLFGFNQYTNHPYTDTKLIIIRDLFNWSTFQTPIYLISSDNFREGLMYALTICYWLIFFILFFNIRIITYLFCIFITYFQLILLLPTLEIVLKHLLIDEDYVQGIFSLSIIIIFYFLYFLLQRNYQLPQRNIFFRRYSYYNFFLITMDIGIMIIKSYLNELVSTILLLAMYFFFFIDSFFIEPYSYQINQKYVCATTSMFTISIIKLSSFTYDETNAFYFYLILTPFVVIVVQKIYEIIILQQQFNSQLTQDKFLILVDIISNENTNLVLLLAFLKNLQKKYKIICDTDQIETRIQATIIQLFHQIISSSKHNDFSNLEKLYLYKILYITNTCKRNQLGYIELKQYECLSIKQSYFFQIISEILRINISKKKVKNETNLKNQQTLVLSDIRMSELLYEKSTEIIIDILESKQQFWINLQKGYQKIEQFQQNAIDLSLKIWKLRDEFFNWFQIQPLKLQQNLYKYNALELKLLAILYSAILNDYHSTLEIELRIEEIIAIERNTQNENINNTTLLNDELVMIATSFAKSKSLILNKNRGQLATFFGFLDEQDFQNIIYIEQLMPTYIQTIHDKIIQRYMKKGYSMLTDYSKEVYIKMKNNFIQAANISLIYMFENTQDYIVTGALQKVKTSLDFIIFDRNGKIQAISENIFSILSETLTLDLLLARGFIYFWFYDIFETIKNQKEQLLHSQDTQLRTINKSQLIYPLTQFNQLANDHEYYRINSTMKNKDESLNYLTEFNDTEHLILSHIQLEQNHFIKEDSFQFIKDFTCRLTNHSKYHDYKHPYYIRYQLTFQILGGDILPVFVLQIMEIEKMIKKVGNSTTSYTIVASTLKSSVQQSHQTDPFNESQFYLDGDQDQSKSINLNPPIINKNINADSRFDDTAHKYPEFHNEQNHLISPRNNNKEILIPADEFEEDDDDRVKKNDVKSSSQINNNKQDIVEILQQNKELRNEDNNKGIQQSQSSTTTDKTQLSIFNILKNLQYTQKYQTTLIKVWINTISLTILIIFLVILQLVIARNYTNTLQYQIPLVRSPDKFNRFYCTFTILGYMDLQMKMLGVDHGQYYAYRIKAQSQEIRSELDSLIIAMENEFSQLEQNGQVPLATIRIINQYIYFTQNTSLLQFDQMMNENTQMLNYLFQENTDESLVQEQVKLLFMKANLNILIEFMSNLVESIVDEFFQNVNSFKLVLQIFLYIQLSVIMICIALQFQLWVDPYIYQQHILLLICRISDQEVELLQQRYKQFKDLLLKNLNKWKQQNYFSHFFNNRISQIKKNQKLLTIKKQQSQQQRAKVMSRIQDSIFSIIPIYIMLFSLWFLLTSFVLSSFLFYYINTNDSYPELNLCMQFVRFKQEFESTIIISQLLKDSPLLMAYQKISGIYLLNPEYNKSNGFFATNNKELLNQFQLSLQKCTTIYPEIYSNIVGSSKISQSNKDLLLGLYQQDLCQYIPTLLPFCNYTNGVFTFFPDFPAPPDDSYNNRESLKFGFNGLYQEIVSLYYNRFVKELNDELESNLDEIKEFIKTKEFVQLLEPYFYDLDQAIVQFYVTIITSSSDILETNFQISLIYYSIFGFFAISIFLIVIGIQSSSLQKQIRAIRQSLIVLPHESLLDIQIVSAIKRIEQRI